jgi:hypothetical protein
VPGCTGPVSSIDSVKWWTRSERIRTASEVTLSFSLTETEQPVYQRIAREVERLRALGFSFNKIAEHLCVDDKTVAKALGWFQNPGR